MPKLMILAGVALIALGFSWMIGERFGLGRLPGDLSFQSGPLRVYLPITTSLLLSVLISVVVWLLNR